MIYMCVFYRKGKGKGKKGGGLGRMYVYCDDDLVFVWSKNVCACVYVKVKRGEVGGVQLYCDDDLCGVRERQKTEFQELVGENWFLRLRRY